MVRPENILHVCEKYGILGKNFWYVRENFLHVIENYGILRKIFWYVREKFLVTSPSRSPKILKRNIN